MANPVKPESRPIICSVPVKETHILVDPATGSQKVTKQWNISPTPEAIIERGFVQETGLVEQELNDYFNYLGRCDDYLMQVVHTPLSYSSGALPPAADNISKIVFVSDVGSGILAFSDGTNWKKLNIGDNI